MVFDVGAVESCAIVAEKGIIWTYS